MAANELLPEDFTEEQMIQLMNSAAEDAVGIAKRHAEQQ
jgi:hypothetical protein